MKTARSRSCTRPLVATRRFARRVLSVYIAVVALACESKRSGEQIIQNAMIEAGGVAELPEPNGAHRLTSRVLSSDSALGLPYIVRIAGGLMLVADAAQGPRLHVFDASSGVHLRSVGRPGQGPGEFEGIASIGVDSVGRNAIYVFDYDLLRITTIDAEALRHSGVDVIRTVQLAGRPSSVAALSNGRWFATNANDSTLYQIADSSGTLRSVYVRSFDIPSQDSIELRKAYKGRVCGTNETRIAVAFSHFSHVSIMDLADATEVAANTPHAFRPTFIEHPLLLGAVRTFKGGAPGVRHAYLDCESTSARIYALFSGRLKGKGALKANFGRFIHEFDWTGRLLRVLVLDHDAISIAVSGVSLITVGEDGDVPVLRIQSLDGNFGEGRP